MTDSERSELSDKLAEALRQVRADDFLRALCEAVHQRRPPVPCEWCDGYEQGNVAGYEMGVAMGESGQALRAVLEAGPEVQITNLARGTDEREGQ